MSFSANFEDPLQSDDIPTFSPMKSELYTAQQAHQPHSDVLETEQHYQVLVDLPGVDGKDLHVLIDGHQLTIKADRKLIHEENEKVHTLERNYGAVLRIFKLPLSADMVHGEACFKNGVLSVTFPKIVSAVSNRKLEVKQNLISV